MANITTNIFQRIFTPVLGLSILRFNCINIKKRDERKQLKCRENGITLITIPHWWDGTCSSLAATIHQIRPDIDIPASQMSSPIPSTVPHKRIYKHVKNR